MPFLKKSFILDPSILLWDALSHVIFYWFFATTAQQWIILMFLGKKQLVLNFVKVSDFSSQYSWRKYKKPVIWTMWKKNRIECFIWKRNFRIQLPFCGWWFLIPLSCFAAITRSRGSIRLSMCLTTSMTISVRTVCGRSLRRSAQGEEPKRKLTNQKVDLRIITNETRPKIKGWGQRRRCCPNNGKETYQEVRRLKAKKTHQRTSPKCCSEDQVER